MGLRMWGEEEEEEEESMMKGIKDERKERCCVKIKVRS